MEGRLEAPGAEDPQGSEPVAITGNPWRQLGRALDLREAARAWAPVMLAQAETGEGASVFLRDPEGGRPRAVAHWPEARMPSGLMLAAAEAAMDSDRGVVRGAVGDDGRPSGGLVALATPLTVEGQVQGAVGLELLPRDAAELREAMRRLQWGAAWMRDLVRREAMASDRQRYDHAIAALNAVIAVAERDDIATAARAAATDLATRFGCDRVSVGFRRFGSSKVVAISHSAQFARQMNLVRLLGAAMDEAIDQRGPVLWPAEDSADPVASHRHEKLARAQGAGQIVTVPLYALGHFIGAITFERPAEAPFTQDDLEILEAVTTVLAPVLDEKRRNDRWLITKLGEAGTRQFVRLFGPGYLGRKIALIAVLGLGLFFWFATGADRISAEGQVAGRVQRTVAAPYDGFIAAALARAGDPVTQGQLLVQLDDREMALERLRLVTERQRQQIEYDRALAARDRAEAQARRAEIAQAEAEIALIDKQLERARLSAPFDGLVISGDLSQSIGASVARGDALLTVAPTGEYRLGLDVDERRIADVHPGQSGTLVPTALPDHGFPFEVTQITPVAEYGDGATTFRVEASFTGDTAALQPGMEGVAKIDAGEKRLIAIWTRPMTDWARLWAWRWLPE
ncbi:HlyD family efflux transporter periplasmic adaptor subunit [Pseudooceanicola sp. CBS1P-1]|uniref:HlyD family efflux transporter periplasmic adaptor subunit n=1 Tax=Pseudooceanicola albus TaxID=2692189 RepID=A0A6L7G7M1_9RHOB|nr:MULTISPECIES: HlyD family efflux transporter periplasmic adaptor subunit [Pseudooceanicola]MBT9384343.1 HlyD family efflux transporter periplasmic adaptor subunit [Pseudooceanicola endophyticus]MXN19919.1 HlyD family efflux transporter periplasmic adaptor subunit [Pseudooceanicola albus]